jgi:hypothetical protein
MLAALFIAFFLGGSGGSGSVLTQPMLDNIDARIQLVVQDSEREADAQDIVKKLSHELKSFNKFFKKSQKAVTKSFKDHAADAAEMSRHLSSLETDWLAAQQAALDFRFAMKDTLTREEWDEIFSEKSGIE